MICASCGTKYDNANAWLRIGPHDHKPLVRLEVCIECGDALVKLIEGWKEKGLSPKQLVPGEDEGAIPQ